MEEFFQYLSFSFTSFISYNELITSCLIIVRLVSTNLLIIILILTYLSHIHTYTCIHMHTPLRRILLGSPFPRSFFTFLIKYCYNKYYCPVCKYAPDRPISIARVTPAARSPLLQTIVVRSAATAGFPTTSDDLPLATISEGRNVKRVPRFFTERDGARQG